MLQSVADPWGSRRAFGPPELVGARSSLSVLYTIHTFVECVQRSALLLHSAWIRWAIAMICKLKLKGLKCCRIDLCLNTNNVKLLLTGVHFAKRQEWMNHWPTLGWNHELNVGDNINRGEGECEFSVSLVASVWPHRQGPRSPVRNIGGRQFAL